jgi:hypothetical protein
VKEAFEKFQILRVFKDLSKAGIPEWVLQIIIPRTRRYKNVSTIYPGDIRNLLTLNYPQQLLRDAARARLFQVFVLQVEIYRKLD